MAVKKKGVIVGLGSIGRRHARLLSERDDVEIAVCDTNDKMIQAAFTEIGEVAVYRTIDEVLDAHPDFIVVATPHDLHAPQTVAALERGVHVLCEKPMSDTLAGANEMKAAAERSSAVLSIAFMLHFNPAIIRIRSLIESGALGTVLAINYRIGSYVTLVNSGSRYQAAMRGALLLDYAHQPDLIYWILGSRPKGVYCAGAFGGDMEFSSNPNVLTLVCDYDTPLLATIALNYLQMPERHECEVIGDQGWVSYDMKQGELIIGRVADDSTTVERFTFERDDMYREEHRVFLDAAAGNAAPSSPADEAIASIEIIDASLRSLDSGARIEL